MSEKLTIQYDRVGDILYVEKCRPYTEQSSDEVGDEVVARFKPHTGDVESVEILFFMQRLQRGERIELPLEAEIRVSS